MYKTKNAITLVALIITVIVLLILAGVSIYMILGQNGLLNNATNSIEISNKTSATEIMNLKLITIKLEQYEKNSQISLQIIADKLCEDSEIEYVTLESQHTAANKIIVGNFTKIYVKLKAYKYEFEVGERATINAIDGEEYIDGKEGGSLENGDVNEGESKVRVTYNLNGGSSKWAEVQNVEIGSTVNLLQLDKPKKSGYKFLGWSLNGTDIITELVVPNYNVTVTALWEMSFEIGDAINSSNYGKVVTNYNSSQATTWKLFYQDESNVFLIADYPILNKSLPTNINSILEESIGIVCDDLNKMWAEKRGQLTPQTEGTNAQVVAWMLNKDNWNGINKTKDSSNGNYYNFQDDSLSSKIRYIIGSPSVELYIASYNATHDENKYLCCTTESSTGMGENIGYGYFVGQNNIYLNNGYTLSNGALGKTEEGINDHNGIYWQNGKTFWLSSTAAAYYDNQFGGNVLYIDGSYAAIHAYTLVRILFSRKWIMSYCMFRLKFCATIFNLRVNALHASAWS